MLAWIAVGSTAEPDEDLVGLAARARVMVGDGRRFGPTGDGHLRVCLARPSDWFIEGVERLVTLGRPPRR
jgi:bifunctional pyridoxal-dependent enzyme with beta-cystathionase and maltose regulon repressor activities